MNNNLGTVDIFKLEAKNNIPMYISKSTNIINHDFLLRHGFKVVKIEKSTDYSTGCGPEGNSFEIITYENALGRVIVYGLMGYRLFFDGKDKNITANSDRDFLNKITLPNTYL